MTAVPVPKPVFTFICAAGMLATLVGFLVAVIGDDADGVRVLDPYALPDFELMPLVEG